MPSAHVRQVAAECWNCDQAVAQVVEATLTAPSGHSSVVRLCHACFVTVYLPLVSDERDLVRDPGRGRSVLVVDDDPGILGLLRTLFEGEGFRVDTATNGLEALEKARAGVPDAIVLDLCMPVMSGQEFLSAWRETAPGPAVPVLAISAYDLSVTAEDLGVQAFLPKPLSMVRLLDTVDALVGPRRSAGTA